MDIKNLTLEQKIGQMIIAGFHSLEVDAHLLELIEKYHIGNVILFARNVADAEQIYGLNQTIQKNMVKSNGVQAFISIDQEGGVVNRIYKGATLFPGNMAITASPVETAAYDIGRCSGKELHAIGINFNLAPVLDVNNNPHNPVIGVRSYGDDAKTVGIQGAAYIQGLQEEGVAAVGKHFPGHGDTDTDSHLDLPCVPHDISRLQTVELVPFQEAIAQGVAGIMTAHVLFPAIEEDRLPATLSYKTVTGLLRNQLGFEGLVITDCMEMKAIANYYGTVKAAVMAVKAGADLICISHTRKHQIHTVEAIRKAVESGEIPLEVIDKSVKRILKVKNQYRSIDTEEFLDVVGCKEHKKFAASISVSSITMLQNKGNLIPIRTEKVLTIAPKARVLTGADDAMIEIDFARAGAARLGGEFVTIDLDPSDKEIIDILDRIGSSHTIVLATYNAHLHKGQQKLIDQVLKIKKEVIHVVLRDPYDAIYTNQAGAVVCSYEYTELAIESILNILRGEEEPRGRLPVSIGGAR